VTEKVKSSQGILPLALASSGQNLVISNIRGGRKMRSRLHDLGLNPGADIRVIKNDSPGPLIIAVKGDSRLALGRVMANHILVSDS
jgi:ferrous iron transport protein A